MKVLVSTRSTQGLRPDDRDDCPDGELLWIPDPCGEREVDGSPCSCGRMLVGVPSRGWTTTAVVRDLPGLGRGELLKRLRAGVCRDCCPPAQLPWAAERLLRAAAAFPEGTLVERTSGGVVRARFCVEHQHAWDELDDIDDPEDPDDAEDPDEDDEGWVDSEP